MKHRLLTTALLAGLSLAGVESSRAATISLDAIMDPNGYHTESTIVGGGTAIGFHDADGADAWYALANAVFSTGPGGSYITGPRAGSPIVVFPHDTAFNWGSLSYDEGLLTGVGIETIAISSASLDVSGSIDQNLGYDGSPASVTGLGLVYFDSITPITFGALDANDTLTFTNGVLTGVNLNVTANFSFTIYGITGSYDGTFSIEGTDLLFHINDDYDTGMVGVSTVVWNLPGALQLAAVPEPSACAAILGALALLGTLSRRRPKA